MLESFGSSLAVAVFGAGGGLGRALVTALDDCAEVKHLDCYSSKPLIAQGKQRVFRCDLADEASIQSCLIDANIPYDLVIVATGVLHDDVVAPEKSLKSLSYPSLERVFAINTFAPMIVAKHVLPNMPRDKKTAFAALSARVGSISDNQLGGWYAYRASKAALNQLIKTASIEHARRWPQALVVGLHPGTVDTGLSKPFQSQVSQTKLFSPKQSATYMLDALDKAGPELSGQVLDYKGAIIAP